MTYPVQLIYYTTKPMHKRDSLIDLMKGTGMLLVIFAHTYHGLATQLIYLFHMPLFFLLSGAALTYSRGGIRIGRRVRTLVVPYMVFSLLSFAYWALLESRFRPVHAEPVFIGPLARLDYVWQQFVNIFAAVAAGGAFAYNVVMWFIPCLFVAIVLYEGGVRRTGHRAVGAIVALALYVAVDATGLRLPWCAELALLSVPLLCLGEWGYSRLKTTMEGSRVLTSVIGGGV